MPVKFKDSININNEYTLPLVDGDQGEALITDGAGNVSFGAASAASSGLVLLNVKNTSGAALSKGDPVHVTGNVGNSTRLEVDGADASDSTKMPAVGVLTQDLADDGEGTVTITGYLKDIDTTAIDGSNGGSGDVVYVKPGGGLTYTKPTGSNLIQNIAKVGRDHANGSLVVSSIMRTNDVPTPLYIDHANQRLGIGTTSPRSTLEVDGQVLISNTAPFLDFVDTNSFTDINDRFRVRAGGNQGLMQWYDSSSSSLLTLMTLNPNGDVIVPNGNFGIGTTSPSTKLHVYESSALNHVTIDGNNGDNRNLRFATEDSTRWNVYATGTSESGSNVGSDFTIARYADGGSYLGNPFIIKRNTGNVGIGTTSPSQALDVNGKIRSRSWLTGADNTNTLWSSTSTGTYLQSPAATGTGSEIAFRGSDTAVKMLIDTETGNVGIGTTAPEDLLHIDGGNIQVSTAASGEKSFAFFEESNGGTGATIGYDGNDNTLFIGTTADNNTNISKHIQVPRSTGYVGIGTGSPVNPLHVQQGSSSFSFSEYNNGATLWLDGSNGDFTGGDYFNISANGTTDLAFGYGGVTKMLMKSNGNVGIGTTSPSTKLEIRKTLGTGLIISSNSTLRLVDTNSNLNAGQGAAISLTGAYNSSGTILDGAPYIRAAKTNSNDGDYGFGLQFGVRTNGAATPTSAMAISSSSQLKLNTYGSGTHTGTVSKMLAVDANGNVIETTSGSGSGTVDGTGTTNYVSKWSDSNTLTNGLIYDTGSYIGVGTTSPSTKTHIRHTTKIDDGYGLLLVENTNTTTNSPVTNSGINVKNHHGTSQFMQWENHGLRIGSRILTNSGEGNVIFTSGSDSERMRITSGGELIINGTTSAYNTGQGYPLHVKGTSNQGFVSIARAGQTSGSQGVIVGTDSNNAYLLSRDNIPFILGTNNLSHVFIEPGGNVGIGAASPSNGKLTVSSTSNHIALETGTAGDGRLNIGHFSNGTFIGTYGDDGGAADVIRFGTHSGDERMRITSGGDVSIGTTSVASGAKLTVAGNATITGTSPILKIDGSGHAGITLDRGSTSYDSNLMFATAGSIKWRLWNDGADDTLQIRDEANSTNVMTWKTGGNVGIGTTSPETTLTIEHDSAGPASSTYATTASNANLHLSAVGVPLYNHLFMGIGSATYAWIQAQHGNSTGQDLSLNPMGGNVGIGTTSPDKQLTFVAKNEDAIQIRRFTTGQGAPSVGTGISWTWSSSTTDTQTWAAVRAIMPGNSNSHIAFSTKPSSGSIEERMRITDAGYVGINTTSPTAPLDIVGVRAGRDWAINNRAVIRLDSDGATPADILFGHTTAANETSWTGAHWSLSSRASHAGNKFYFYRASGNPTVSSEAVIMTFDPNLNVGIGTTTPSAKLEVAGTIKHQGVVPSEGTNIDQIKTVDTTLQLTADTWTDTGIDGSDLSTGTYVLQVYVEDFSVGGGHYYEFYSGIISWYSGTTNSDVVDEIVLHRAGHSPNTAHIQLRVERTFNADSHDLMLQIKSNRTHTAAMNGASGKTIRFKFRRLI